MGNNYKALIDDVEYLLFQYDTYNTHIHGGNAEAKKNIKS